MLELRNVSKSFGGPAGRCVLDVSCDATEVRCKSLPGDCPDGQVRAVVDGGDAPKFAAAPRVRGFGFEAVGRPSFYGTWIAAR